VEEMQKAVYEKLAANSFESLIEKYPDSVLIKDSLVYLAKINTDLGHLDESIHYYEQAADRIENPVEKQKIYFNMVRNLEMMQQNQKAVDKLKQIIDIGAHSVYLENAYLTLAGYYRIIARERPVDTEDAYGAMIVLLQEMLAIEELGTASRRDALMLLAEAYFELDSYDRCEEALTMIENLETADESFTLNETDVLAIEGYRKRIEMHSRMGR
jgi:tetratricopeptide (TPR) repeat protein